MIEPRFRQNTLFGEEDVAEVSGGDLYLAKIILGKWDEARERASWFMDHLPLTGDLMLYEEDVTVLREGLENWVLGNFSAAIILSMAFIERVLSDFVLSTGAKKKSKAGLAQIATYLAQEGQLEPFVSERIIRLNKVRNNFVHEQSNESEHRIFRRSLKLRMAPHFILAEDGKEAVCLAHAIAIRFPRSFSELALHAAPASAS